MGDTPIGIWEPKRLGTLGWEGQGRMGCMGCIMGVGRTGHILRNRHTGEDDTGHWLGLLHPGTVGDLDL